MTKSSIFFGAVLCLAGCQKPPSNNNFNVGQTDRVTIEQIESSFLHLGERLEPEITKIGDPKIREELRLPFDVVKVNLTNEYRDFRKLEELAQKMPDRMVKQANINYFSFRFNPHSVGVAASFVPIERCVCIDSTFDTNNIFDLVVLYHELRHVVQDTLHRVSIKTDRDFEQYQNFLTAKAGEKTRILLVDETTAYAYELELLNLISKGQLKTQASDPGFNGTWFRSQFAIRDDQLGVADVLAELSVLYFPEGLRQSALPKQFVRRVAERYWQMGYDLFILHQGQYHRVTDDSFR